MSENVHDKIQETQVRNASNSRSESDDSPATQQNDSRRWWTKLILQPVLFFLAGVALLTVLGLAQNMGWISAGGNNGNVHQGPGGANVQYICPMMCTPPQSEPGRCPVCAMELVPATSGAGMTASNSIQIDPVARRLANIHTVPVKAVPFTRTIKAIGELHYDEGTMKTISAYVDGRLDRLYADYTGIVVKPGDKLALLYSPTLYSGQVELLEAKKARVGNNSNLGDFYGSARQKLLDLGMTKEQLQEVEKSGKANSRIHLLAPISGTVIEKLAVEGQYVKEGQAIYKLADLSTIWLMLKAFPEEAAVMQDGQKVTVEVQSLPGQTFTGRVAFIDPMVDQKTRTVGVRVVMPNEQGVLRVGDYAKATVRVPMSKSGVFVKNASEPMQQGNVLMVPRRAVLMAGDYSVVYVETEPGRFEIRQVQIGPSSGDEVVILKGVKVGEKVATSGNFLIDSQMQLAGNPSLIDPTKFIPHTDSHDDGKISEALASLSPEDQTLAKKQRLCPITDMLLGLMGPPLKVNVKGTPVFICCKGCQDRLLKAPKKALEKIAEQKNQPAPADSTGPTLPPIGVPELIVPESNSPHSLVPPTDKEEAKEIAKALSKLSPLDRALVERQKVCAVANMPLGSMGTPIKVDVNGQPVFICCEGCRTRLLANSAKYLGKLSKEGGK